MQSCSNWDNPTSKYLWKCHDGSIENKICLSGCNFTWRGTNHVELFHILLTDQSHDQMNEKDPIPKGLKKSLPGKHLQMFNGMSFLEQVHHIAYGFTNLWTYICECMYEPSWGVVALELLFSYPVCTKELFIQRYTQLIELASSRLCLL